MVEGRRSAAWDHTAALMAWIANTSPFRSESSPTVHPDALHPFKRHTPAEEPVIEVPITVLKTIFVDR